MVNAYRRIGYGRFDQLNKSIINNREYIDEEENIMTTVNPETITFTEEVPADTLVESASIDKRKELYRIQESKRAPKIQVDQKVVLTSWLVAVGVAFIASAIVSFNGITSIAEFVGLSAAWMSGLFFFFIELMYLIFLVAYLVLASRVDELGKPESTWGALWGMIAFAGVSVAANAFHTFDYWNWQWSEPQMWAGVVLSVAAPIAIISASKLASRVVFARAVRL